MTTVSPAEEITDIPSFLDWVVESDQDVFEVGKSIIVKYDEKRYVGQVLNIQGEKIQGNCMVQHGKKNPFQWPDKEDIQFQKQQYLKITNSHNSQATTV